MVLGTRICSWIVSSHCFFSLQHQGRWLQNQSTKRLTPCTTKVWEGNNEHRAVTVSSVWRGASTSQQQLKTVICQAAMPWHLGLPSWAVLMNWKRRADGSRNWQSSPFGEKSSMPMQNSNQQAILTLQSCSWCCSPMEGTSQGSNGTCAWVNKSYSYFPMEPCSYIAVTTDKCSSLK